MARSRAGFLEVAAELRHFPFAVVLNPPASESTLRTVSEWRSLCITKPQDAARADGIDDPGAAP
jgi:hypothetical protein